MNSSFAAFDFAIMSPAHSRSRAVCFVAFAIIGLCVAGSKRKAIAKAVETNGLAYPICIDRRKAMAGDYSLDVSPFVQFWKRSSSARTAGSWLTAGSRICPSGQNSSRRPKRVFGNYKF